MLAKLGHIKMVMHRSLQGTPKTAIVKRTPTGKWFVSICCEEVPEPVVPESDKEVGIDVGLKTFAYLSDGTTIEHPRFFRTEEKNLAKAQRKREKAPQRSQERKKLNKRCARIHERAKNRRKNFAPQESHKIVKQHGLIVVEALVVRNMVKNPKLAKSIADASWSLFFTHLQAKAEEAGRMLVRVDPAYTSQRCSCCVTPVKGHHLSGERSPTSSGNGSMPNVSLAPEREVKNHSMTLERESDGSSRSERLSGQSRHGES